MSKTTEMKVTFGTKSLVRAIGIVERAIGKNDVMPILKGIMLDTTGQQVRLVATDRELGVECYIDGQVDGSGKAVLDGKMLSQIVRKLDGDQVSFAGDEDTVRLESGSARFDLQPLPHEDFPELPQIEDGTTWRLLQCELKRMIKETIFAAARDEARPALTSAMIEIVEGEIRMVATDANRLAYRSYSIGADVAELEQTIVPLRTMQELARLLSDDPEKTMEFVVASNQAVFDLSDDVTLVSRLIEGIYPDYRRVFPNEEATLVRAPRAALLAMVERASLVFRGGSPVITLRASPNGHLMVDATEPGMATAHEELAAEVTGASVGADYQAHYIAEALRAIEADDVTLEMRDSLKQGSLRAVGDDDFLYVFMPMRTR